MFENKKYIPIIIDGRKIELTIFGESLSEETVFEIEGSDAIANGEAPIQIKEGCFYEYKISNGFYLEQSEIVSHSKVNPSSGRIAPNIYVGTLSVNILEVETKSKCGEIKLEVQSVKTSYRQDYRQMLEEITEKCTDLLLQHGSPASHFFEVDFKTNANTLYQRFAFLKSILDSEEFSESVHKILTSPVTKWKASETQKDIRCVRRMNSSALRQITSAANRIDIPKKHPLKSVIKSIPLKIILSYKSETVNTPENRFIKYALNSFLKLIEEFKTKLVNNSRLSNEAKLLEDKLEQYLNHSIFKEILIPSTLHLNSPILQRKEGYREILRTWLMFDLAAKLVWHGGDDVYSGGKKDVAVLYEYWLFFKLIEILREIFHIEPEKIKELIKVTKDGLGLQLKQGRHLPIKGVYHSPSRKLAIEFSYNKTFPGDNVYPEGGSWTKIMRPDYTLSIWPYGIDSEMAERQELVTHIHFDAKYKVESIAGIFGRDEDFKDEKDDQKNGKYKRADLLKMHAYKDAIRRTAGAYILYPGTDDTYTKAGFHELIPGLGAFAIRPSRLNNGIAELKKFLTEVVHHFLNRASQRELMSFKTYDIYKNKNGNEINEILPEPYGTNRSLLPSETFVLIGFYKNSEHLHWILSKKLYNARTGSRRGSLRLSFKETGAKYLLLHTTGETKARLLLKLKLGGPRVFSKEDLISKSYHNPSQDFYLVYDIEESIETEFLDMHWDITKLNNYSNWRGSALPFSVTLTELMKVIIR